ncbi:peptidoglycan synthetase [Bacteroidetes bacterium UKL13-3]|nr:peptidoglycan synthetase [Bacteroidetes bacterium UKL13-3]HCP94282.1 peptidoglycan synthetase [Bacteroidota bacterium]
MRVHFISIGGAVMHNLALALHHKGFTVTGSDDEIYEPAKSRLEKAGILPTSFGWNSNNITPDLDAIVLGMHARKDNPELIRAQELGLKIYSFPEYMYEQTKDKKRIVIGGSHGKTSTTAMILFVLKYFHIDFDYLVGSIIDGFDTMVGISNTSKIAVFEGDEYLNSALDPRPKFHFYHTEVGIITGIAWDHVNVFPTYENYVEQFEIFIKGLPKEGALIYCADDAEVKRVSENTPCAARLIPYTTPENEVRDGITYVNINKKLIPLKFFGKHNMQNMMAAKYACLEAGITEEQFYEAIQQFKGTAKRLETIKETPTSIIYRDFAHAPSKLKATVNAVKNLYPNRKLIAAYELHTFSSLNKDFLPQYHNTMEEADVKAVLYSKHALEMKKMPMLNTVEVAKHFGEGVAVFTDKNELRDYILNHYKGNENLLLMSSGTFDGMNVEF